MMDIVLENPLGSRMEEDELGAGRHRLLDLPNRSRTSSMVDLMNRSRALTLEGPALKGGMGCQER